LTLDGIAIQRGSNTLTDIIGGATIDILRAQEATEAPTAIDISADTEAVKASVQEFLDAYNDSYAYLQEKVRIDQTTYERGDLAGDFSYKSLWLGMRSTLANAVTMTDPEDPTSLGLVGITAGRDGVFTITDETKLFEMVVNDPEMLAEMFNDTTGIGSRVEALIDRYVSTDGIIDSSKDSVEARRESFDRRLDSLERQNKALENRLIQQFGALQEARNLTSAFQATLGSIGGFLG
ncbi:MAG: flagellar filament capping protein FliD, partial [Gemmatimonadetes bacterium]|nr:flagellar filament capping protein FliD [Gemmatimonadota bacterium]